MSNKRKPAPVHRTKPAPKPAPEPSPAPSPGPMPALEPLPDLTPAPMPDDLPSLQRRSISSIEDAIAAVRDLSAARLAAKLSVSRLTGVARELRELLKVMSVYGC